MKTSNEVKLGITIFVAVIVLVSGIVYLRGIDFQKNDYTLNFVYDNVNGLAEGSEITIAGFKVGKVEKFDLYKNGVTVRVAIEKNIKFSDDSKAYIKSSSIMGGKIIAVTPGVSGKMLNDGDTLVGAYEADLTELTSTLAPISSNVLGILERVNTTFDAPTQKAIQNILKDLNRSSSELERVIKSNGNELDIAISNFAKFTNSLSNTGFTLDSLTKNERSNLAATLSSAKRVASELEKSSLTLNTTVNNLNNSTKTIDVILNRLEKGEGTLGKLSKDANLYNDLDSTVNSLNRLLKDIKANPSRYINIKAF